MIEFASATFKYVLIDMKGSPGIQVGSNGGHVVRTTIKGPNKPSRKISVVLGDLLEADALGAETTLSITQQDSSCSDLYRLSVRLVDCPNLRSSDASLTSDRRLLVSGAADDRDGFVVLRPKVLNGLGGECKATEVYRFRGPGEYVLPNQCGLDQLDVIVGDGQSPYILAHGQTPADSSRLQADLDEAEPVAVHFWMVDPLREHEVKVLQSRLQVELLNAEYLLASNGLSARFRAEYHDVHLECRGDRIKLLEIGDLNQLDGVGDSPCYVDTGVNVYVSSDYKNGFSDAPTPVIRYSANATLAVLTHELLHAFGFVQTKAGYGFDHAVDVNSLGSSNVIWSPEQNLTYDLSLGQSICADLHQGSLLRRLRPSGSADFECDCTEWDQGTPWVINVWPQ